VKRDTAPEPTLDGDDAVEWGGNEVTPVARVCPDCTAEQIVVGNFVPPPDSVGSAWGIARCCGTVNQGLWRWCWTQGDVTEPALGRRTSYDRRKVKR
jgi:hypothetical protein